MLGLRSLVQAGPLTYKHQSNKDSSLTNFRKKIHNATRTKLMLRICWWISCDLERRQYHSANIKSRRNLQVDRRRLYLSFLNAVVLWNVGGSKMIPQITPGVFPKVAVSFWLWKGLKLPPSGVGLDDPYRSLPAWDILWFCGFFGLHFQES